MSALKCKITRQIIAVESAKTIAMLRYFWMNVLFERDFLLMNFNTFFQPHSYLVMMMEMLVRNFLLVDWPNFLLLVLDHWRRLLVELLLVHVDRLVDFVVDNLLLSNHRRLVMDVHRLHHRMNVLLLLQLDWNMNYDFPMASTN